MASSSIILRVKISALLCTSTMFQINSQSGSKGFSLPRSETSGFVDLLSKTSFDFGLERVARRGGGK